MILSLTVLLIVCGALLLGGLECANPETLAGRPWYERVLPCLFQSVTARTAGFNTVDLNALAPASLLLIMALMFIGAAPGGTGGGVKVTTFGVLVAQVLWVFRPHREPTMMGRGFARTTVRSAVALTVCALGLIALTVAVLLALEEGVPRHQTRGAFLDVLFEVFSAFGTVGLSLGITPILSDAGKWILAIVMLLGRIGPLGLFAAALSRERYEVEYPSETLNIG